MVAAFGPPSLPSHPLTPWFQFRGWERGVQDQNLSGETVVLDKTKILLRVEQRTHGAEIRSCHLAGPGPFQPHIVMPLLGTNSDPEVQKSILTTFFTKLITPKSIPGRKSNLFCVPRYAFAVPKSCQMC